MNTWENYETGAIVKQAQRPATGDWRPVVNAKRVTGTTYSPYITQTDWAREANKTLAAIARDKNR